MSVKSSTFGSVRLTGADAKKFQNQVRHGRPKAAAKAAYARGLKAVKGFDQKGFSVLTIKK